MANLSQNMMQKTDLRQEQTISAQQIQSLDLLHATALELQNLISQAMEQNPVLEIEEQDFDSFPQEDPLRQDAPPEQDPEDMKEAMEQVLQLAAEGNNPEELNMPRDLSDEAEERRNRFFESVADVENLWDHLSSQLRLSECSKREKEIAELIIEGIDETGYLRTHPADIAMMGNCSMEEVESALKLVQSFDPPGIGARDLKECLLLQIEEKDPDADDLKTMICDHLEDIAKNRLSLIGSKMELPPEAVQILVGKIRKMNPFPGGNVIQNAAHYVIPEAEIVPEKDGFKVIVQEREIPRLRISEYYEEMLNNPETQQEAREYLAKKIQDARELMDSLEKRKTTIGKIAELIASEQFDFLKNGVESLHPMTMKLIADKLNLSESTVSRAISNKYIRTPQGVFEFKYFFSGGFTTEDGSSISSKSVKELIRELVDGEDPRKPLSDSKLTDLLSARGIEIRRRTVAKYREELGIQASHLRKVII